MSRRTEAERAEAERLPPLGTDARAAGGSAPNRLVAGSQLAKMAENAAYREMLETLDICLRPLRAERARLLEAEAEARELRGESGEWHRMMARALGLGTAERFAQSVADPFEIWDRESGEIKQVCTCRQLLCPLCEGARLGRFLRRVAPVAAIHDARETARGLMSSLVTLSVRHSGNAANDAALIRKAWPTIYRYLKDFWGTAYLYADECTQGQAGTGNSHRHVVCWLPWLPYEDIHRVWWRALALAGDGEGVSIVQVPRGPGERGRPRREVRWLPRPDCGGPEREVCGVEPCSHHTPGNVDVSRGDPTNSARDAVVYLTKATEASGALAYVAKEANFWNMDAQALAGVIDGGYRKRRFAASVDFWRGGPDGAFAPDPAKWQPTGRWPERSRAPEGWWRAP